MHESSCAKFDSFQRWISMQNWPELLKEGEKKYLYIFSIYLLYCQSENAVANEIDATVTAQQEDWPNIRIYG